MSMFPWITKHLSPLLPFEASTYSNKTKTLADKMNAQNNLATSCPIYCIYDKREILSENGEISKWCKFDDEYSEVLNEDEEVEDFLDGYRKDDPTSEEAIAIGLLFGNDDNINVQEYEGLKYSDNDEAMENLGYEKRSFEEISEFKGRVFLTMESAEQYIAARKHHFHKPFVYVHSCWDADEMKTMLYNISQQGETPNINSYPKPYD